MLAPVKSDLEEIQNTLAQQTVTLRQLKDQIAKLEDQISNDGK